MSETTPSSPDTDLPARPEIVLVVAVARNGVIGAQNAMPWYIPADLRHFRRTTLGRPVIMGRKTFESIGKPLPGRHNIVLTRDAAWRVEGVTVAPDLDAAIARADAPEIMVIGGAGVFAEALPRATRIEWTAIDLSPEGDTFMPAINPAEWEETAREETAATGETPAFAFLVLRRRGRSG